MSEDILAHFSKKESSAEWYMILKNVRIIISSIFILFITNNKITPKI